MALENQPLFQAPSIPKMGKRTVSSSIFSNVSSATPLAGPKLRTSRFSFIKPKAQIADAVVQDKSSETVASALIETNRILVEIQKQLALDFASRITERKQSLSFARSTIRREKASRKESFIESGAGVAKEIGNQFKQVVAPAQSIFSKLIDFLTIVGGGIVLNTAWEWLKDEKNREKVVTVFKFIVDNWKLLVGVWLGGKLLGAFFKVSGALRTLKDIVNFFRGPRRPPGTGPGGGTNKPGPRGGGGWNPDWCVNVLDCVAKSPVKVAQSVVETLVNTPRILIPLVPILFGLPDFQRVLDEKIKESGGPIVAQGSQEEGNAYQRFTNWFKEKTSFMDPFAEGLESAITSPAMYGVGGFGGLGAARSLFASSPLLGRLGRFFGGRPAPPSVVKPTTASSSSQQSVNLDIGTSSPLTRFPRGSTPKVSRTSTELVRNPIKKKPPTPKVKANQVSTEGKEYGPKWSWRDIQWKNKITKRANEIGEKITDPKQLLDIYAGKNNNFQSLVDKAAARDLLLRKHNLELPKIMEGVNPLKMDSVTLKALKETVGSGLSKGGTVFGKGSQSTDSVPAMLAPGEEVIRASAANQFRPLLKDINDNAGRMFIAFKNGIQRQERNNLVQEETSIKLGQMIETLNDEFEKAKQRSKMPKKLRDLMKGQTYFAGGPRLPATPQKPLQVSTKAKPTSSSIQTYNVKKRSSSSGQPTIVNMPMPAMNLAGNQSPQAPETNIHDSSSTPITISSFDSSNPYISEVISSYGIFV